MATELAQDYAFYQISCAVMATANSVTGTAATTAGSDGSSGGGESSIFDVVRRKISKVQDVLQGFAAPLKRRSVYEELPAHVWPRPEQIEMSHLEENPKGQGHVFVLCQLSNPTWCDYCGDFIWGLYKQCMRCQNCHFTSHDHCVPSVTLNCITVPEEEGGGSGQTNQVPSPTDPKTSLETSLSLSQNQTRPGCAKNVSTFSDTSATTVSAQRQQQQLTSAPKLQVMSRTQSLPECNNPPQHPLHPAPLVSEAATQQLSQQGQGSNAMGVNLPNYQRHSSSPCLQGLPPTPSAIDDLTQGNDDARFITSSHVQQTQQQQQKQYHNITAPPTSTSAISSSSSSHQTSPYSNNQQPSIPPTIQEHPLPQTCVPAQITTASSEGSKTVVSEDVSQSSSVKLEGEAEEQDETDSGYRSGTIPDDKLPKVPSQATLDRQELKRKITKYNHFVPAASFEMTGKNSFQGFIKVTMNLIRPITMELGARPPSIYELLTREHIIEENTQQVAFYMPRDTHKSLHITSDTTTRDVVSSLLKKFHILDHPRKFAMYEQEFSDKNKLVRLRRLNDKNHPLAAALAWDPERINNYRMVLQENETGEIVWDAFSLPELGNFLKVLDREEKETIQELRHKYTYMRQIMEKRLAEFKSGKHLSKSRSTEA